MARQGKKVTTISHSEEEKERETMAAQRKPANYVVDETTGERIRVKDDGTPWGKPIRKPENTFVRWATGMLTNFYHIPSEQIAVRNSPLAKKRTIYVLVNGNERAVRNETDLHNVVAELVEARKNIHH